jgi:hypothetical protein
MPGRELATAGPYGGEREQGSRSIRRSGDRRARAGAARDYPGPCGNCDNDLTPAEAPPAEVPFAVGARVVSERWGEGTVQRYDGDQVAVLFGEHGYRELFVPLVLQRALLRPA